jgi:hypothetical protein
MRYAFSEVRKTVIGLVGFAVAVLAAFLTIAASSIPNEWLPWVQVIVAVGPNDVPPDVATHYDPGP